VVSLRSPGQTVVQPVAEDANDVRTRRPPAATRAFDGTF
jgi:hypothetical protein